MSELLPIGRFGKEAQLTPRQLRYYHALGVLVPASVDPDSGYRYYAEAQLATAELVSLQLEEQAMSTAGKAPYAYGAFSPEAQQALLRAQSMAEAAGHPEIKVVHLMAAMPEEFGSTEPKIMAEAGPTNGQPVQPLPGPAVQEAIAGAFSAAGVSAPGQGGRVTTTHLAQGCLATDDGKVVAARL